MKMVIKQFKANSSETRFFIDKSIIYQSVIITHEWVSTIKLIGKPELVIGKKDELKQKY